PAARAPDDGPNSQACQRGDRHQQLQCARAATIHHRTVQGPGPEAAAGLAGELWISVRHPGRRRLGVRCALSAQPALRAPVAAVLGERWPRGALHALVSADRRDRKSTRLNSSHVKISYAVFCLKKTTEV